jgi:hypothetical protein
MQAQSIYDLSNDAIADLVSLIGPDECAQDKRSFSVFCPCTPTSDDHPCVTTIIFPSANEKERNPVTLKWKFHGGSYTQMRWIMYDHEDTPTLELVVCHFSCKRMSPEDMCLACKYPKRHQRCNRSQDIGYLFFFNEARTRCLQEYWDIVTHDTTKDLDEELQNLYNASFPNIDRINQKTLKTQNITEKSISFHKQIEQRIIRNNKKLHHVSFSKKDEDDQDDTSVYYSSSCSSSASSPVNVPTFMHTPEGIMFERSSDF